MKYTSKLVCTGDSLADLWPHAIAKIIPHDELCIYQNGGSGLELQTKSLLNHYLSKSDLKDTLIVSQFTGANRRVVTLNSERGHGENAYLLNNVITKENDYIVNEAKRIQLYVLSEKHDAMMDRVRDYVSVQCMLSELGADVRVFRGWRGVFPEKYWYEICRLYDVHGVKYTDETYVETALMIDADESKWLDEYHPDWWLAEQTISKIWNLLNE